MTNGLQEIEDIKNIPILAIADALGIQVNNTNQAICFKGHDKNSPSLSFNTKHNYFKCFGCGIKGSNIDLVKQSKLVSIGDAIRWLKETFFRATNTYNKNSSLTQKIVNAGQAPANKTKTDGRRYSKVYKYFLSLLSSGEAVSYLKGRGLTDRNVIEYLHIKALPEMQFQIIKKLRDKFGGLILMESGLIKFSHTKNTPYLTLWNNRLIIPYFDLEGNIFNLQGRNIDNDENPKYRFLPGLETGLYNISSLKKIKPKSRVFLCEGALDVIACYHDILKDSLGFLPRPAIGLPGVHGFKDRHFRLLKNYDLVLCMDNDEAGNLTVTHLKKEFLKRFGKGILSLDMEKVQSNLGLPAANDLLDVLWGVLRKKETAQSF